MHGSRRDRRDRDQHARPSGRSEALSSGIIQTWKEKAMKAA